MADERGMWELLDTVQDPCSLRMGKPLGLVEMGLVQSVDVTAETISVRLLLTGPGCVYFFQFSDLINSALQSVAEGRSVQVIIDDSDLWTTDRIGTSGYPTRQEAAASARGTSAR